MTLTLLKRLAQLFRWMSLSVVCLIVCLCSDPSYVSGPSTAEMVVRHIGWEHTPSFDSWLHHLPYMRVPAAYSASASTDFQISKRRI